MKEFSKAIQTQLDKMCGTGKLFRSSMTGQQVWDLYIGSFTPEQNPVFRDPNSSVHNCNLCNNFIRRYGNVLAIDENNKLMSIFDVQLPSDSEYYGVAKALTQALTSSKVVDVFFETFEELKSLPYEACSKSDERFKLGIDVNRKIYTLEEAQKYNNGAVKAGQVITFNHLHVYLPKAFVKMNGRSAESIEGEYRDAKNVFQRGMQEISLDTLNLVVDLINQGSLLDGAAHLNKVVFMVELKKKYDALSADERDNWCWVNSYENKFAKFRNELIGTLCVELSEGKELNDACQTWNRRVDPSNYMKATAPITKSQINEARKFVEENGYAESFNRRLATIKDIMVDDILHVNNGDGKIKTVSVFDNVKSTSTRHKRSEFKGIEEVGIEKFMSDILPGCSSMEVFLQNEHEGNLVTLTTAVEKDSKRIFKWNNNYSHTFKGNLAGKSMIKDAVKSKGGKVDGVLRFSIMWAENDPSDNSDLDAHAVEPNRTEIAFNSQYRKDRVDGIRTSMSGQLDVDITNPGNFGNKNIVENIAWETKSKMKDGKYRFFVNQYSARGSKGFKAEIEFEGETFCYEYNRPIATNANVEVAVVTLKNGVFSIEHALPETQSSKELYGLATGEFHKVRVACLSPNHWGENAVGNKYYLFMLEGCKCDESVRGFHNENLIPDLLAHRKVMEVLGASNMITPSGDHLAGVGFNATVRDEVIVRLSGTHKRVIKIKF